MSDLWSSATHDIEAERSALDLTQARVATADLWAVLASATTEQDFANRLDLVADRVGPALESAGVSVDPQAVIDSWRQDHTAMRKAAVEFYDDLGPGFAPADFADKTDDVVARWESKGGATWIEVSKTKWGYDYKVFQRGFSSPRAMGTLGRNGASLEEALADMDRVLSFQDVALTRVSLRKAAAAPPSGRSGYTPGSARVGEPTPQSDPDSFSSEDILAEIKYLMSLNRKSPNDLRTLAYRRLMDVLKQRGYTGSIKTAAGADNWDEWLQDMGYSLDSDPRILGLERESATDEVKYQSQSGEQPDNIARFMGMTEAFVRSILSTTGSRRPFAREASNWNDSDTTVTNPDGNPLKPGMPGVCPSCHSLHVVMTGGPLGGPLNPMGHPMSTRSECKDCGTRWITGPNSGPDAVEPGFYSVLSAKTADIVSQDNDPAAPGGMLSVYLNFDSKSDAQKAASALRSAGYAVTGPDFIENGDDEVPVYDDAGGIDGSSIETYEVWGIIIQVPADDYFGHERWWSVVEGRVAARQVYARLKTAYVAPASAPSNIGGRDCDPKEIARQIGPMNIMAISGGRVEPIIKYRDGGSADYVGVRLPVSNGYAVHVYLANDDTYTVQRVYRDNVKGEQTNVYFDEVGEAAYQASSFRSNDFGGHVVASKTAASDRFDYLIGKGLVGFPGSEIIGVKIDYTRDVMDPGEAYHPGDMGYLTVRLADGREITMVKDFRKVHTFDRSTKTSVKTAGWYVLDSNVQPLPDPDTGSFVWTDKAKADSWVGKIHPDTMQPSGLKGVGEVAVREVVPDSAGSVVWGPNPMVGGDNYWTFRVNASKEATNGPFGEGNKFKGDSKANPFSSPSPSTSTSPGESASAEVAKAPESTDDTSTTKAEVAKGAALLAGQDDEMLQALALVREDQ